MFDVDEDGYHFESCFCIPGEKDEKIKMVLCDGTMTLETVKNTKVIPELLKYLNTQECIKSIKVQLKERNEEVVQNLIKNGFQIDDQDKNFFISNSLKYALINPGD